MIKQSERRLDGLLVAVVTANGADAKGLESLKGSLRRLGARVQLVVPRSQGGISFHLDDGRVMHADAELGEASPSYWDAVVVAPGAGALRVLDADEATWRFLRAFVAHRRPVGAFHAHEVLDLSGLLAAEHCVLEEPSGTVIGAETFMRGADASDWSSLVLENEPGEDINAFVARFAELACAMRGRELVDELSLQSFPASDSAAGAGI